MSYLYGIRATATPCALTAQLKNELYAEIVRRHRLEPAKTAAPPSCIIRTRGFKTPCGARS